MLMSQTAIPAMSTPSPRLAHVLTLHVDLAPPLDYGSTATGDKRFIPITGGRGTGPKFEGKILPNTGGDWNSVRADGVVHLYARYTIQAEDETVVGFAMKDMDEQAMRL